jgi:hypothetical protein
MPWKLKSLTDANDDIIVSEWLDSQTPEVQFAFETRMKFLVAQSGGGWDRPNVGQLHGKCKGLFEIRLKVNKVQYRPIGYFSGPQEFTFVAFATERDGKFDPPDICKTAQARRVLIELNKERSRAFTI